MSPSYFRMVFSMVSIFIFSWNLVAADNATVHAIERKRVEAKLDVIPTTPESLIYAAYLIYLKRVPSEREVKFQMESLTQGALQINGMTLEQLIRSIEFSTEGNELRRECLRGIKESCIANEQQLQIYKGLVDYLGRSVKKAKEQADQCFAGAVKTLQETRERYLRNNRK